MSASPESSSHPIRRLALIAAGFTGLLGAVAFGGCAAQPIAVPTRSLERSGRASFVCLAQPRSDDPKYPGRGQTRPITDCTTQQVLEIGNYVSDPEIGADLDKATEAECVDGGPKNDLPAGRSCRTCMASSRRRPAARSL